MGSKIIKNHEEVIAVKVRRVASFLGWGKRGRGRDRAHGEVSEITDKFLFLDLDGESKSVVLCGFLYLHFIL